MYQYILPSAAGTQHILVPILTGSHILYTATGCIRFIAHIHLHLNPQYLCGGTEH